MQEPFLDSAAPSDSTASLLTAEPAAMAAPAPPTANNEAIAQDLKAKAADAVRLRRQRFPDWKTNVEMRIGRVASSASAAAALLDATDDLESPLNPDWSLTKTKTANLMSQVPDVRLEHENVQYAAATTPFAKQLNYEISEKRANLGVAMEEVLNDVVNASGVAGVFVGYAARTVNKQMPTVATIDTPQGPVPIDKFPPEAVNELMKRGAIPSQMVPQVVSDKFFGTRLSPTELLLPAEFVGSDFNEADWVGRGPCRIGWAEGKLEFKLTDEQKGSVLKAGNPHAEDDLRTDPDRASLMDNGKIQFTEQYYWRYRVDPDEPSFTAIWRLVYVDGIDQPVIHEPWKGQKLISPGKYAGACKFPIQVLTLTYITDNPIPPSDSAAGRPQVKDLRRSRSQMFANRDRSRPLRWIDVGSGRISPLTVDQIQQGTWQGFIPVNGDGARSIGEVARASYPSEDLSFDQKAESDLNRSWGVGENQQGMVAHSGTTKAEVQTVQANFTTNIGKERAKVARFFLNIVEVMAGLIALYSDFPALTPQEKQAMLQAWDVKTILPELVFTIRPDATIMLDTSQKLQRIERALNMTGQSGYVNIKPLIAEYLELSGIDPTTVMIDPQQKVEEPNVSYRFSGKDDLQNPMVVAMLKKKNLTPSPQEIEEAKQLLLLAQMPAVPQSPAAPAIPGAPAGADGQPPAPENIAHPEFNLQPRIAKRTRDVGAGA